MPRDEPIREPSCIDFICAGDRRSRCSEKAELVAGVDSAVLDLLWPDDHADCGAGSNDRVAAFADSPAVPRQPGIIGSKESSTGKHAARGFDPSPGNQPLAEPVKPIPVNPGTNPAGPVFPGRSARGTAAWYAERSIKAETAGADAVKAGVRFGG